MLIPKSWFIVAWAFFAAGPLVFGQSSVRINEVLADNVSVVRPDGSTSDWVELTNTSPLAVSLAGASLTDDTTVKGKWFFPAGVSIPGNGLLVVNLDKERTPSTTAETFLNAGFSLGASGDAIYFYGANLGPLIDSVTFGPQVADYSIGRADGVWRLCSPTPGAANIVVAVNPAVSALRVNEWLADTEDDDWFEIFNGSGLPIAMEGLYLTDNLTQMTKSPVPPLSFIGAGGFVQFIADGNTNSGPEHVAFSLRAEGEVIAIFDGLGTRIDFQAFTNSVADVAEGLLPDGVGVKTRFPTSASPGEPNYKELASIIVSEVLTHTDPPFSDAVEFYNTTDAPVNIGGWFLSNKKSDLKRYRIPANTFVPARGYKAVFESAFNGAGATTPFTFNSAHGDQVYLAEADVNGTLSGFRAGEDFEAAENGVSFGRVDTSVAGVYQFVAMARPTFGVNEPLTVQQFETGLGAANSGPKIGPVVLNEIMYNPPLLNAADNTRDEFIELFNTASTNVPLYDVNNPQNPWRLQNGVSFVFPLGRTIPAFGYALVVSFDPANATLLQQFKAVYSIPETVAIYGPYRDAMGNGGTSLELYKADPPQAPGRPDAGFVPFIRVDKVNFSDSAPWPTAADRGGLSLQRKSSAAFGNDSINWDAGAPTPGVANSAALRDADGDGAPDVWEDLYSFNKNNNADGAQDTDGDSFSNVQEYIAGTHPRDAGSLLRIVSVVPAQSATAPLTLSFVAQADKSYSVQTRNSLLETSSWQTLEKVAAGPAQRTVTALDAGAWGRADRYYRIVTPAAD